MATISASDAAPEAVVQAINISVDAAPANTATGYDTDNYPASPQVTYYISVEATGEDTLLSEVFSTNEDGTHTWSGVIIPAAGSWTAHLRNAVSDASVANTAITAS
jgi:hypothetical protein